MDLEQIIRSRGLKMQWVADQLGIHQSTFSRLMNGRKRFEGWHVKALAKILKLPQDEVRKAITTGFATTIDGE